MSDFGLLVLAGRLTIACVVVNGNPDDFANNLREFLEDLEETKNYPALIVQPAGACNETGHPKFKVSWCATDDKDYQIKAMSTAARAVGAYDIDQPQFHAGHDPSFRR